MPQSTFSTQEAWSLLSERITGVVCFYKCLICRIYE